MAKHIESAPDNTVASLTIPQVAAEITRLYRVFDKLAVNLDREYYQQQLAGPENVTWKMFPKGLFSKPTPILDRIMRQESAILLGAGYNSHQLVLDEFRLAQDIVLIPQEAATYARTDAVTVRRTGYGYDPGEMYTATNDRVLQAGYTHHTPVHTLDDEGRLVGGTPHAQLNSTFHEMTEVNPALSAIVSRLQAYELLDR